MGEILFVHHARALLQNMSAYTISRPPHTHTHTDTPGHLLAPKAHTQSVHASPSCLMCVYAHAAAPHRSSGNAISGENHTHGPAAVVSGGGERGAWDRRDACREGGETMGYRWRFVCLLEWRALEGRFGFGVKWESTRDFANACVCDYVCVCVQVGML